jgi:hypothetical protein
MLRAGLRPEMSAAKGRLSTVSDPGSKEGHDTAADQTSELKEADEAAGDPSQCVGESASVAVLSAEVRVLQVGNGQITRSMYRQLDEAAPERFEPFGRVKNNSKRRQKDGWLLAGRDGETGVLLVGRDTETGALVRYQAQPPDWSVSEGPEEFAHWTRHWVQLNGRPTPPAPVGRRAGI